MKSLVMSVVLLEEDCVIDIVVGYAAQGDCIIDIVCVLVRVAFVKEIPIEAD